MKNYIKVGLLMVLPSLLMAQGGIRNQGATIKVSSDAQLKIIHGGILHQENGAILNNGEIRLTEDWRQQGENSQYLGNGTLIFSGNTNQQLSSDFPLTIANLAVNNGHRLILNNDLQIQQQLDLYHNGSVELGANNLLLDGQTLISNYDEDHYIVTNNTGFLQQEVGNQEVMFPIGNSTYNPVLISNQGVSDDFQVHVVDQSSELEGAVDRTWQVEEVIEGGSLVSLELQWNENQELTNFDRNESTIRQENSNLPTDYSVATAKGALWSQVRTNLTDLTTFTVTSLKSDVLPQTRLNNGKASMAQIQLFPNPAQDHINIQLEGKIGTAFIEVFDVKGSLVLQTNKAIGEQNIVRLDNLQHLVEGVYSIQITNNDQTTTHKFVKGQL